MKKQNLLYILFLSLFITIGNASAQECQPPSNFEANQGAGTTIILDWDLAQMAISYELVITDSIDNVLDVFILSNSTDNFLLDFSNYNQTITATISSNCENEVKSEGISLKIATIESVIKDGNFCNSDRKGKIVDSKGGSFDVYDFECVCQVIGKLNELYNCSTGFSDIANPSCTISNPWNSILKSTTSYYAKFYGSGLTSFLGMFYESGQLKDLLCNQGCKIGCTASSISSARLSQTDLTNSRIVVVNPVSHQLNVKFNFDEPTIATIRLISLSGQVNAVLESDCQIAVGEHFKTYDLNNMNAGIYLLYVATETEIFTNKILKE